MINQTFIFSLLLMLTVFSGLAYASSVEIYAIQERLNSLGFEVGTADGLYGKKTKSAIKKYQQKNGLPPTGTIDENLKQHLNITEDLLEDAKQKLKMMKESTEKIRLPFDINGYADVTVSTGSDSASDSGAWTRANSEDVGLANGSISDFEIDGRLVPLKSNKVRNSIIETVPFGNLEYRFSMAGPKGVYGTRSQIKQIEEWLKKTK